VNWKLFVGAAKAGNEIVFEGANGTFRSIPMDVGWDQLEIHMLSNHEILEGTRMLHCPVAEDWVFESCYAQSCVCHLIGL